MRDKNMNLYFKFNNANEIRGRDCKPLLVEKVRCSAEGASVNRESLRQKDSFLTQLWRVSI